MDLSKCKCDKPGMCPVFGRIMGEDPPDWKWCQTANIEDKREFYNALAKAPLSENGPNPKYTSVEDLLIATKKLIPYLNKFDGFVGVPRSGVIPASYLAVLLSKPLYSINNGKIVNLNYGSNLGGRRMNLYSGNYDNLLFIEDTSYSGASAKKLKEDFGENIKVAAIFSSSYSSELLDLYSEILEPPHILEWNFFNAGFATKTLFDIDGIFCDNVPIDVCEDEERYIEWIKNVEPKYERIPKLYKARKLVTGRLEKYRNITEVWLERHGFNYNELIMFPTEREEERNADHFRVVGEYKAQVFNSSKSHYFFVESEIQEAQTIKLHTDKPVICPNYKIIL